MSEALMKLMWLSLFKGWQLIQSINIKACTSPRQLCSPAMCQNTESKHNFRLLFNGMILCARNHASVQRLQAWSFLSASFRDTQVLSMDALSLHHTRWSVRPKTCAANWAAASGERIVEQPRPGGGGHRQDGEYVTNVDKEWQYRKCCTHRWAYAERTRHPVRPSLEWEEGNWWRDRPCFQTSPGPDRCFCQPQPQRLWARHHLKGNNSQNIKSASPLLA